MRGVFQQGGMTQMETTHKSFSLPGVGYAAWLIRLIGAASFLLVRRGG